MKINDNFKIISKMITAGFFTGILTGFAITIFSFIIYFATKINKSFPFLFLLIPLAALLTLFLYKTFGEKFKKTTDIAIEDINKYDNKEKNLARSQAPKEICPQMGILAILTTGLTHLVGASGGKEGAGVHIGFSCASIVQKIESYFLKLRKKDTDIVSNYYLMSGAAAAFSALFGAPIAGVLFATQLSSPKTTRLDALLPCIVSSYTAVFLSSSLNIHTLHIPEIIALDLTLINAITVAFFAVLIGLYSKFFCYFLHILKNICKKFFKSHYMRVFTLSLTLTIASLIVYLCFDTFKYNGLSGDLLEDIINGKATNYDHLIKLLFVALTFASSFMGGEVVPLLVIGSGFGLMFANIFELPISAFTALGAVGMLAGATNLPYVCFALGLEFFGYSEPALLFLITSISFVASGKDGIYHKQRAAI